jgi:hypothetical protein
MGALCHTSRSPLGWESRPRPDLHGWHQRLSLPGRRLLSVLFGLWLGGLLALPEASRAQDQAPAPAPACTPVTVTDDAQRLLELGTLLLGQNNPAYAKQSSVLAGEARNIAGEQACNTFARLVKHYPDFADGWRWLGTALLDTLRYTKATPAGQPIRTPARVADAVAALRTAYELQPTCLQCVSFYGDALMEYCKDFEEARKIWECYWQSAQTTGQRVLALTQLARACLNKAYFGRACNRPLQEVRTQFLAAENYLHQARKLNPKAEEVKEMQFLLQQHRKTLYGE